MKNIKESLLTKKGKIALALIALLFILMNVRSIVFIIAIMIIYNFFKIRKDEQVDYKDINFKGYTPLAPKINESKEKESEEKEHEESDCVLGLGVTDKKKFELSDKEFNAMCLLLGATGAGKTTAIKTILDKPMKNNYPIVIIDGKGSPSFYRDIEKICIENNRTFKLFNIGEPELSYHYSFLKHGGFTELKDKIISIFDWTEEHYKLQAERFLQGVFKLLQMQESKTVLQVSNIDFSILCQMLNLDSLNSLIDAVGAEATFMKTILSEVDETAIRGLMNRIQSIAESEVGKLFEASKNLIDIKESIEKNEVVFFSMDSLKFAEYSKALGRLIIADLKTVAPRFYGKDKKIYCVFDEFNVFASEIIVNLINKTREYGFRNIISTQELADMMIDGDRKLLDQIWGNTNIKIALRQDVYSSQEELAKGVNKKDYYKVTVSQESEKENKLFNSGQDKKYSAVLEEEYIYKPKEFGQLGQGEAIVYTKYPQFRHAKIKIRRVFK